MSAEADRLREALAEFKGGVRLLAEELEAGADPKKVAVRLHEGCDFALSVLEGPSPC